MYTAYLDASLSAAQVQQANQDLDDGHALRLLKEALPEGYAMRCHPSMFERGIWFVDVWQTRGARGPEPTDSHHWLGLSGDTIAEAADKCREALT